MVPNSEEQVENANIKKMSVQRKDTRIKLLRPHTEPSHCRRQKSFSTLSLFLGGVGYCDGVRPFGRASPDRGSSATFLCSNITAVVGTVGCHFDTRFSGIGVVALRGARPKLRMLADGGARFG